MRKITLVRGARQLLTLRGPSGPRRGTDLRNLGIIQDGAILIADGVISEVGPTRRLENLRAARGAEEIDASGCVVLPGLVDSHAHLVNHSAQELSPRALKTLALRAVEEGVRCGTTAFGTKSGELKILRVYAALRELPLTLVSTYLVSGLAADAAADLLATVRKRRLADFAEIRNGGAGDPPAVVTIVPDIAPQHASGTARMLIDGGAAVALASGENPASLQMAVALACRTMALTTEEAITAATLNGAHAMGRARVIGSLEAGKSADLAILSVPDYRELPYHFGVNLANVVMIRGAALVGRAQVRWPSL